VIDLHTHTLFSDGELLPAELIRRAEAMGHRAIAMTDHVDMSNLDLVVPRLRRAADELNGRHRVRVLAGAELTHVPPELIAPLMRRARELGAQIVVVHGETIVELVQPGTNLAGIEAGADVLAHPGLLSEDEARLAAERGVALELSARKGHCLGNGRVAALARRFGAQLVVNTDSHAPSDLIARAQAERVAQGAGLDAAETAALFSGAERLLARLTGLAV
jgi:histidinol phosphatase-like PHP family hydrolase